MATSFCPQCATPRAGNLRYCASCAYDFWDAAAGQPQGQVPPPEQPARYEIHQPPGPLAQAGAQIGTRILGWVALIGIIAAIVWVVGLFNDGGAAVAPTPTPERTAEPTAVHLLVPVAEAFVTHYQQKAPLLVDNLQKLQDVALTGNVDAFYTSALTLEVLATNELKWLQENEPDPCFADLHAKVTEMWTGMKDAAGLYQQVAQTGDPSTADQANAVLLSATEAVQDATSMVADVQEECAA